MATDDDDNDDGKVGNVLKLRQNYATITMAMLTMMRMTTIMTMSTAVTTTMAATMAMAANKTMAATTTMTMAANNDNQVPAEMTIEVPLLLLMGALLPLL